MLHGGRNSGRVVARMNKGASAPRSATPRKHIERGRIGPVQILKRQHHRLNLGAGHHPVGQRRQLPAT